MSKDSLLSFSEILLFGREVAELKIVLPDREPDESVAAATTERVEAGEFTGNPEIDGVDLNVGDRLLVHLQKNKSQNGIYTMQADGTAWGDPVRIDKGKVVYVEGGDDFGDTFWQQKMGATGKQNYKEVPRHAARGRGQNQLLDEQLMNDARFARIYGFSYEGTFYELPSPVLLLVHGEGDSVTDGNEPQTPKHGSRAPLNPDITGVAAADFQFADDIKYWSYDKSDYTIRMDVMSGQFEQVLLDLFFEVDLPMMAGAKVSGAKVSGAKVAGAKVSGAKVSGAKVAGAKVSGAKVGGFGD